MHQHVLFVDDEIEILKTLRREFRQSMMDTTFVPSGAEGLAVLQQKPASVIVADMRMPEMDGVAFLCKSKEICPDAVRIVLSGHADLSMIMAVINENAIWRYVTKPWNAEELQLTIRDALEKFEYQQENRRLLETLSRKNVELEEALCQTRTLNDKVTEANWRLEELVESRTQQLRDSMTRLQILDKTKGDFLSVLSHEFRTPINGLLGTAEILINTCPKSPENDTFSNLYDKSRERIIKLLDDMLLLANIEVDGAGFPSEILAFDKIVSAAIETVSATIHNRHLRLVYSPWESVDVVGDRRLMLQAVSSLLKSAFNFCKDREQVTLSTRVQTKNLLFQLSTEGLTLSAKSVDCFFEAFAVRELLVPGADWALDPVLAKRIMNLLGGSVRIENVEPEGICMTASLPLSGSKLSA